jgi:hypothetical protein
MKTNQFSSSSRCCKAVALACLVAAGLPACAEAEPRELGFTQSAEDLSTDDEPSQPFYAALDVAFGRWVGQAEEPLALSDDGQAGIYAFPSGSTRIGLELVPDADGSITGQVTFGVGDPLPPVSNPDVEYPPGVAYDQLVGYPSLFEDDPFFLQTTGDLPPFEGFAYAVAVAGSTDDNKVPDGVIGLAFNSNEPLSPWCALQTSYPRTDVGYSCAPDFGGQQQALPGGTDDLCTIYGPGDGAACLAEPPDLDACAGGPRAQIDCDKLVACNLELCSCAEEGCYVRQSQSRLQLRRVGDELVGLFENARVKNARGLNVPLGQVRFHLE